MVCDTGTDGPLLDVDVADCGPPDNRNPKDSAYQEKLRKRLSPRELAAYERGESCHRNHLENMPL